MTSRPKNTRKHFWVPPPALTSPAKVEHLQRSKSPKRRLQEPKATRPINVNNNNESGKPAASNSCHDFIDQLEELLDEIRRVKSSESFTREGRNRGDLGSGRMQEVAKSSDLSKPNENVRLSDKERFLLRKSLGLVKEELLKSVSESAFLSDGHSLLVEKLRRIEEDAGDAVRHVASLRHFIQRLSQEEITKSGDSASRLEKTKELLFKLSRLDDANRSLQNLVGGIATLDELQPVTEPSNHSRDEVEKQKSEIKSLQGELKADRQEILKLKVALNEAISCSNTEKQSLKSDIKAHRERANKYLADFDAIRTELNAKNDKLSNSMMQLENHKLSAMRLSSENSKLKFENGTMKSKLNVLEGRLRADDSSVRTKMNEIESSFHRMSSKATVLELENTNLKLTLDGTQTVVSRQRSEIERLENKLEKSLKLTGHFTTDIQAKKNKSIPLESVRGNSLPEKSAGDRATDVPPLETDEIKWIKVSELYQIIDKEKAAILQQLKDLEIKLELCEVSNQAFRKELTEKEKIMLQNNLKLQDKIGESNALKESLEVALSDVRKFSDEAKRTQTLDRTAREKLDKLEGMVLRYRVESEQIRKQKDKCESKLMSEIEKLGLQLESVRSANRTLQEYVNFLRNSYADVFGDYFLRAAT